ncbi:YoaK family protein [Ktedonosporobacter rubrisoli]|uniref:YoaK family protein n=1 Tax=Ktedonosporobacter rubrisoli TaxID=2509675 RepID=UPI0013EE5AC1|nr:YoaK family protein [Ktedonosporobacter rubrisoli]
MSAEQQPGSKIIFPSIGRDGTILLFSVVAGSTDSISYLGLGHVFTANMTGNTVLLGLALGRGQAPAEIRSFMALIGFVLGALVGAIITERDQEHTLWNGPMTGSMLLEGVILAAFAVMWYFIGAEAIPVITYALILLSGLAMGIQSVTIHRLRISGVATTYITGTLTTLVTGLVNWLHVTHPGWFAVGRRGITRAPEPYVQHSLRVLGIQAAVWIVYALSAIATGVLGVHSLVIVVWLPVVAIAIVIANALIHRYSLSR